MRYREVFSTYSIVARDPETGHFGGAVQTHQVGVGRIIPMMAAGYGVIASQADANVAFGPVALAMLREGVAAEDIVRALVASDPGHAQRQIGVVDGDGGAAAYTGDNCIRHAGHVVGDGYSIQANMMTNDTVIEAMRATFESAQGDLAQRMMAAMVAAQAEDGDIRGMQSAALKVVPGETGGPSWESVYDLRVDEHTDPVGELGRLVTIRRAHLIDDRGYAALDAGDRERGLALFAEARQMAPDQEELAYWQAVTLADQHDDVATAAAILRPVLAGESRRVQWIDLTQRLVECGMIERAAAADALIAALG